MQFADSKKTLCKITFEKRTFIRKNTNFKHIFNYNNSKAKRSQPVANLFHNNRTTTFDSENLDIFQQQYSSHFTRDNVVFPDYPQRVATNTLCK